MQAAGATLPGEWRQSMSRTNTNNGHGLPELLTVRDVQDITQLGRTKVYELIRNGELPVLRIGRSLRIRRDALDKWLLTQEDRMLLIDTE